jgi:hypothetical protein
MDYLLALGVFGATLMIIGAAYCRHDMIGPMKEERW